MKGSKLQNDYLKHRSEENRLTYKKQHIFFITFLMKKKADYLNKLDPNLVKTISAYFINNPKRRSKIKLVDEKDNTLSEDEKIVNRFFGNIMEK